VALDITNPGSGCTTTPTVSFSGGGGTGAAAVVSLMSFPIFDAGGSRISTQNSFIDANGDYLDFDNIEVKNQFWALSDGSDAQVIGNGIANNHLLQSRFYVIKWSHTGSGSSDLKIFNQTCCNGQQVTQSYNYFDGTDSTNGGDTGEAGYAISFSDHNIFTNMDNGILSGAAPLPLSVSHHNVVGPINTT